MKITSYSVNQTRQWGRRVASFLQEGDIICLFGGLGSGKTIFTKGIAEGLGIPASEVISPTFVLLRQYRCGLLPLYHFDFYRLGGHQEILDLGYEEYFYRDGVTVVEWPQRLGCLLPNEYLKLSFFIKEESVRVISFIPFGKRYKDLVQKLYANTCN